MEKLTHLWFKMLDYVYEKFGREYASIRSGKSVET